MHQATGGMGTGSCAVVGVTRRWIRAQPVWFLWVLVIGTIIRLAVGIVLVPAVQARWFSPFVESFVAHPTLDPWNSFLSSGGDPQSFPYGPVMLAYFSLFGWATSWLPAAWSVQLGIFLGLFVLDVVMLVLVAKWSDQSRWVASTLVVLSPIGIYATYVHGQLDLLPTVLMFGSALALSRKRWTLAGVLIGLAIAAKFSSALVPPIVLVFLLVNARYRSGLRRYVVGMLPGILLTVLPITLSGYRSMVLETPTTQSIFAYALSLGPGLTIVVLPLVYSIMLGYQYWMRRSNTDLLGALIGMMLTAVTLLTPASPGWYLWSLPFLALYTSRMSPRIQAALVVFWAIATASLALRASSAHPRWLVDGSRTTSFTDAGSFVNSLGTVGPILSTGTVLAGIAVIFLVFRESRHLYDVYHLSKAPLSVAIAGDSGTGKDTVCATLASAFGEQTTAFLMGDDYHRYERSSPLWRVTTHLHPSANDLASLSRDAVSLMRGDKILSRHYDHARGRFTKRGIVRQGDLVVLNGLHMLSSPQIRAAADLTVFMSMDEPLRRRLKIERDVRDRGQALETVVQAIERRYGDVRQFIQPQAKMADIHVRLESVRPLPDEKVALERSIESRLVFDMFDSSFVAELHRTLVSIGNCLVSLSYEFDSEPGRVQLVVHPDELQETDIAVIAGLLLEHPGEIFVNPPQWVGGSRGLIQLVIVLALFERRKGERRS